MTMEPGGADANRMRIGLVVLVVGIVLVLWSWGNWVYRASVPEPVASLVHSDGGERGGEAREKVALLLPQVLMYGLLLAVAAFFGGYALLRASRRYRESADRKRPGQTVAPDAWAMHKAPRNYDDGDRVE